jgi:carboxylesterase type B
MTVAETRYGKVRGTEIADGVLAWRGIPYATPPVGDLRFRPPEAPAPRVMPSGTATARCSPSSGHRTRRHRRCPRTACT